VRISSAISRFLKGAGALCLTLHLCAGQAAASDAATSLTLSDARGLAAFALQNDQPDLALRLGRGLLQADARDPFAHYVMAAAYAQMGRPAAGRRAAARAYRFADPGPDRLRSAQLAARMAYEENRPTLAQFWLRRTAIYATSERDQQLLARDYQALRRQNPWSFSLCTDLRPSNNVNNGADSAANVIDGRPDVGTLPPSAVALSGLIGAVDFATFYRLRADRTSATSIGARLYVSRVALSDSAKAQAPGVSGSQFRSTYAELSIAHGFIAGDPEKRGTANVSFALGESWYAGERNFQLARLSGERSWSLAEGDRLTLTASGETRFNSKYRSNNADILSLGAIYRHALQNGDTVSISAAVRDTRAEIQNGTFTSTNLRGSYSFGKPLGPARLSASLGLGLSDYDSFRGSVFLPATRRKDETYFGDVTFFFEDYDYAGFAPTLKLRMERTKSNFSAYTSREISIALGIQSKF
jgi:hypothetical protein